MRKSARCWESIRRDRAGSRRRLPGAAGGAAFVNQHRVGAPQPQAGGDADHDHGDQEQSEAVAHRRVGVRQPMKRDRGIEVVRDVKWHVPHEQSHQAVGQVRVGVGQGDLLPKVARANTCNLRSRQSEALVGASPVHGREGRVRLR